LWAVTDEIIKPVTNPARSSVMVHRRACGHKYRTIVLQHSIGPLRARDASPVPGYDEAGAEAGLSPKVVNEQKF